MSPFRPPDEHRAAEPVRDAAAPVCDATEPIRDATVKREDGHRYGSPPGPGERPRGRTCARARLPQEAFVAARLFGRTFSPAIRRVVAPAPQRALAAAIRRVVAPALALLFTACALELPSVPYFETTLTVPLGRERVSGWDLAEDTEFVFGDSTDDGALRLFFDGEADTFRIADQMDALLPSAEFSSSLEKIDFPDPDDVEESFRIGELTDLQIPEGGASIVVPSFSIPVIRRRLPAQIRFVWLRVQSGTIDLALQNLLPIGLGVAGSVEPALRIRLVDPVANRTLFEAAFDGTIPAGQTATLGLDLSGVELQRTMDLELFGQSAGSLGAEVPVRPDNGIDIQVSFHDVEPDSVIALIPAQTFALQDTLRADLGGTLGVVGGSVLDGGIPITLENELSVAASGTLTFAELLEDGAPVSLDFELPSARAGVPGRFHGSIDLTGRSVRSLDGEPIGLLNYRLDVGTRASAGVIAVGRRQRVTGTLGEAELRFLEVEARPKFTHLSLPPTESKVELPAEVADLELVQATLRIIVDNTIDFPAQANLILRGVSETTSVEIPLTFGIRPGRGDSPLESSVELTESNSDILRLIQARPTLLEIDGEVLLGTDGRTATVTRSDWIRIRYEVGAPFRVRVGTYEREVDDFDFTLSSDLQERIREDVVGVIAVGTIENHFPLAAETRISFASSPEQLESEPEVVLEAVEVPAGVVDPVTGRVRQSTQARFEIALRDEDVSFFARDQVFGRISLRLRGDSLSVIELMGSDFAEVTGALEFRIRVGEDGLEGNP